MTERPTDYLDLWFRKSGYKEIEASFKSSKESISIIVAGADGVVEVAFANRESNYFYARMMTTRLEDKEEVPTKLGDMIALLQTSLDKDPGNHLNDMLRSQVLNQINNLRKTLSKESESLEFLALRVKEYDGMDRAISQGHP